MQNRREGTGCPRKREDTFTKQPLVKLAEADKMPWERKGREPSRPHSRTWLALVQRARRALDTEARAGL